MKTLVKPVTVVAVATLLSVGSTKLDLSSISANNKSFSTDKSASNKQSMSAPIVSKINVDIKSTDNDYKVLESNKTNDNSQLEMSSSIAEIINFIPPAINDLNIVEPVSEVESLQSLIKFEIPLDETSSILEPTLESTTVNYLDELVKFKAPVINDTEILSVAAEFELLDLIKFKVPTVDDSDITDPVQLDEIVKFKAPVNDESIIEEPVIENPNCFRASN